MGAQLDRLRYEVFQNLFYSPMNTVFLRPAIATVLTVYGIETSPETYQITIYLIATVLTVYGIETRKRNRSDKKSSHIATVLTVYGIETMVCDVLS